MVEMIDAAIPHPMRSASVTMDEKTEEVRRKAEAADFQLNFGRYSIKSKELRSRPADAILCS